MNKNGFDNGLKGGWSNLSESLINLTVAVSILVSMLLSKFLSSCIIRWSRSFSFKDIMTLLILLIQLKVLSAKQYNSGRVGKKKNDV